MEGRKRPGGDAKQRHQEPAGVLPQAPQAYGQTGFLYRSNYIFSAQPFVLPQLPILCMIPSNRGKILLKGCLATKPSLVWLRFAQKQCKQPVNFHCCPLTPNQKHTVLIPVSCTCHPFRGISIIWGFWCLWPVNQRVLPLLARHFNKLLGSLCVRERIEKQPVFFAFWIPLTASGKCVIFLNTLLFNLLLLLCLI